MRGAIMAAAVLSLVSLFARQARAGDEGALLGPPGLHISGTWSLGYAARHRGVTNPTDAGGLALGTELRIHPRSRHGIFFAMTYEGDIFYAGASIFEAGYSLRFLGDNELGMGAAYAEIGPVAALVTEGRTQHTVVGGRASLTFDLHFGRFLMGTTLAYRGGIPTSLPPDGPPDRWESAASWVAHLGFIVDVATIRHPRAPAAPVETSPDPSE